MVKAEQRVWRSLTDCSSENFISILSKTANFVHRPLESFGQEREEKFYCSLFLLYQFLLQLLSITPHWNIYIEVKHILIGYSEHGFLCFEDINTKTTTTKKISSFQACSGEICVSTYTSDFLSRNTGFPAPPHLWEIYLPVFKALASGRLGLTAGALHTYSRYVILGELINFPKLSLRLSWNEKSNAFILGLLQELNGKMYSELPG